MKATLKTGLCKTSHLKIDAGRTIGFMGAEGRVYSTPDLVRDIEDLCRTLLLEHCDAGEDSVGMDISLRHIAPTPLGMTVEITATVTKVDGRKISFEISAKDDVEQIGLGTHTRFVAEIAKVHQRLSAKSATQVSK